MLHHKFLSLSLLTSVLVLAGCTQTQTTNTITETTNKNANVEVVTNTNETVGNENTNDSNVNSDVDTSDPALSEVEGWLTYTNEEYGFSFRHPSNWSVKQEWLEQGLTGSKYNIYLQNETADSILFFLTTQDFIREDGEGSIMFVTGSLNEDSKFTINDLEERGLSIYEAASINTSIRNIFYTLESYGGSKLSLLTVFQNKSKQVPFLTIDSPLLADWPNKATTAEIDEIIEEFESGNLKNQMVINEYIAITETIRY